METAQNLPKWEKPLDTEQNCIELVYAFREYAPDDAAYMTAIQFLITHRAELTEDVEFAVPPKPGDWRGATEDPAWSALIVGSENVCGCGQHRVIKAPVVKREFRPEEARRTVLGPSQNADIFPVGGPRQRTQVRVTILPGTPGNHGTAALTHLERPYSHGRDMNNLMAMLAPKGYLLEKLAVAMTKSDVKPTFQDGNRTFFMIESVDPAAGTITIIPDVSLDIIVF